MPKIVKHGVTAKALPKHESHKLSVSLYASDIERLDQIKRFMMDNGVRNITDSSALRLACRTVELGPKLLRVYDAMRSEDGRRTKG